jgi:hypothetical protein
MKLKKNQPATVVPSLPARAATETCPMSAETLHAIRLLEMHTQGRFGLLSLAGRSNAERRAQVMSALVGTRMPQAKSGVNALRAAFYKALGIVGDGEAEREESFLFVCGEAAASAAELDRKHHSNVRDDWDVVTATMDGGVVWRRYGDRKIVTTRAGETPLEALTGRERERRQE